MCVWGVVSEPPLLKEDHGLQHEYDPITEMQVENYYLCLYFLLYSEAHEVALKLLKPVLCRSSGSEMWLMSNTHIQTD